MQATLFSQHNVEKPCVSHSQLLRLGEEKKLTFSLTQENDTGVQLQPYGSNADMFGA